MAKSLATWELYDKFREAFSFSVTPNFKDDNREDQLPLMPATVIADGMTRAYKFVTNVDEARATDIEDCEDENSMDIELTPNHQAKFFRDWLNYMLEPGLEGMRWSTRTYVMAVEGEGRAPAKDMTRIERGYAMRNKPKLTDQQRREYMQRMSCSSDKPLLGTWDEVCGDTQLRGFAMHQLAKEAPTYVTLPPDRRIIFDGCLNKKFDRDVIQDPGKRCVSYMLNDSGQGRQVTGFSVKRVSSVYEGEQAAVRWMMWASDDQDGKMRYKDEKQVLVISGDTDSILALLQAVGSHLIKTEGTTEDWRIGNRVFKSRVVLWYKKVRIVEATGARAPPPKMMAKAGLSPNDVVEKDMFVWINKLWCDIQDYVHTNYSNSLRLKLPCAPKPPCYPILGLVTALMFGANDFSCGLGGITHAKLMHTYLTYAAWIGDLVIPDPNTKEPDEAAICASTMDPVTRQASLDAAWVGWHIMRGVGCLQPDAVNRLLTAAYFETKRAQFKDYSHPSEVRSFDQVRELVKKGNMKRPGYWVPDNAELAGFLLRVMYHMAYNYLAPLDKAHLLDGNIEQYGYVRTSWQNKNTVTEYFIPNNTILTLGEDKLTLRCVKAPRGGLFAATD